ncbi:hypothetical protein [Halorubrum cibi]|uniref:Uncharacterized protein n=1 Tax=Halorubrum cibi TaxID=413815 RepID=A0A521CDB9_9EURY|nr:hypothetical protein [Halorubrum cibi]SMO57413.1 hypothetical protein SAMN06264867_104107 [Halorubrum cibi]
MSLAAAAGGILLALAAAVVRRDARRIGVETGTPALWAGLVLFTGGTGAATALLVPDAPIPGVLVVVALGPLLYLLERDDSLHGDDDPDPTRLPSAAADGSPSAEGEAARTGAGDEAGETDDEEVPPATSRDE